MAARGSVLTDNGTRCFGFEGPARRRHGDDPRWRAYLSYLGEEGSILFLFMTHSLVSLTPGGAPGALGSGARGCSGNLTHADHAWRGKTTLPALEAAYDKLASAYAPQGPAEHREEPQEGR